MKIKRESEKGSHITEMRRNTRHVFWLIFALFFLLTAYLIHLVLFESRHIVENPANPRIALVASEVTRGRILDSRGYILAESLSADSSRAYPFGAAFAHLVGYAQLGQAGVESRYNFVLQRLHWEVIQRASGVLFDTPLVGNDIVLTVNADLQRQVANSLSGQRGAVVALEPSTGRILAMASYPNFDPNTIEANWETLRTDNEASPLLNRAAQGLYPPGSVFKMVTAAAAFSSLAGHDDFVFYCEGETTFGNKRIRCYNATAHGLVDASRAFAVSCNIYYAALIMEMGADPLIERAEKLLFNERYPFPLPFTASSFVMGAAADEMELIETAIGQGRTLVTPMHMAMMTAAAANGGLMMEPYIVNSIQSHGGMTLQRNLPRPLGRVFTAEEAAFLTDIMTEVVQSGTGQFAAVPGVAVGGKTGTAETDAGEPHGWFIAFAPAEMPQVAVAVVLENAGNTRRAQAISREVIEIVLAVN